MSTTTGNVKISQLSELGTIDNGTKLRIPVSKDKSATSTPDWESYSVSGAVLSKFMENSLGLNDVGSEKGLRSQVTDLQAQTGEYTELEKKLGKYNLVTNVALTAAETNKYISESGEKTSLSGYSISNKVSLKQGNLYLFRVDGSENFPADIAFMSKVHIHEYHTVTGTHEETHLDDNGNEIPVIVEDWGIASETVYEPLHSYYHSTSNGGYGAPDSGYLVFFATEDADVVISSSSASLSNGLDIVKYGAFIEIANGLLGINGEMMKVIVEAIAKNKKDIDSLYEKTKSLGDIHVTSIDSDELPSVQGEPMVVVADRAPSTATSTRGADVPNRIGQIWVNITNGVAYIAVKLGFDGWKQITNA